MQVINFLIENSFAYTNEKESLDVRRNEIGELMEIVAYCQNESVREPLSYQEALWDIYVQEGLTFAEWLYNNDDGNAEDRRRLQEAFSKKAIIPLSTDFSLIDTKGEKPIHIALGIFPDCVSKVQEYIQERRGVLAAIRDVKEYEEFMQSCFINSCFADDILSEMKRINSFPNRTGEITNALGILNDNAVELYQQYSNHLETAMDILSTKLRRECAPDPKHADDLVFSFTYFEQLEGETVAKVKDVECSPHLKLINPGSNLRIYFYWCDEKIGSGKKVLVGRIGRHPY